MSAYIVVYLSKYNLCLFCLFMSGPVVRMAFIFNIFSWSSEIEESRNKNSQ